MRKSRYEYKEDAKTLLIGRYEKPIIVLLVFYAFNLITGWISTAIGPKYSTTFPFEMTDPGIPALSSLLNIIVFLVGAAMVYAVIKLALTIFEKKPVVPQDIIFSGFKEGFLRNVLLQLVRGIFIFLWSLLLIIPGIMKAYAYSMSFYLANKEADIEAMDAINRSKELTRGYKMDLFLLDLSYLGWYILGLFTFGILWLWIIPKHQVARIMYYEEIYYKRYPKKVEEPVLE